MAKHKQKRMKVNAWVDEGIAPLVEALNQFPDVMTTDSCQGSSEYDAYVMFHWLGPANKLLHFMAELSVAGGKDRNPVDFSVDYRLYSGNTTGMVTVYCAADYGGFMDVVRAFRELAKEYGHK